MISFLLMAFDLIFGWVATWGERFQDIYSQVIYSGFLVQIVAFSIWDLFGGTKGKAKPMIATAFVSFMFCLMSIPFVSINAYGVSTGLVTAMISATGFKFAFFYYGFIQDSG